MRQLSEHTRKLALIYAVSENQGSAHPGESRKTGRGAATTRLPAHTVDLYELTAAMTYDGDLKEFA